MADLETVGNIPIQGASALPVVLVNASLPGLSGADSQVVANPPKSVQPNVPSILTAAGEVLQTNLNRKAWSIQNLDTDPLFVRLGTGASTAVFHFILKGGDAADDGKGGFFSDVVWQGVVSIAGTTPRCVVAELT